MHVEPVRHAAPVGARQLPAVHEEQSVVVHEAHVPFLQRRLAQSLDVEQVCPLASCKLHTPLLQAPPMHS